jgi:prepilin-type processing-associated H-X9-DG protein/prepilin-type N-terminal cleavage/methylation domain-containing protein
MMNDRKLRTAFTLVELLVVVSIIALLISIMLPSLRGAKEKSQRANCGTRMRGLSVALQVYWAEFNGAVPLNGLILPKSQMPTMYQGVQPFASAEAPYNDQWRLEFGALWSYMGGPPLPPGYSMATARTNPLPVTPEYMFKRYICPSDSLVRTYQGTGTNATTPLYLDTSSGQARVIQGVGAPGYWSYSVNSVLNSLGRFRNRFAAGELPWSDPLHIINVKAPQDFITFIEEDNNSLMNDEVFDAPAYNNGDMISGRHTFTANVAFGDGHVEVFSQTVFNQVPSGISSEYVNHQEAMASEITRMFFPDRGAFAFLGAQEAPPSN